MFYQGLTRTDEDMPCRDQTLKEEEKKRFRDTDEENQKQEVSTPVLSCSGLSCKPTELSYLTDLNKDKTDLTDDRSDHLGSEGVDKSQ